MILQVEALSSVKTQLPYEYYVLPFCHQGTCLESTPPHPGTTTTTNNHTLKKGFENLPAI